MYSSLFTMSVMHRLFYFCCIAVYVSMFSSLSYAQQTNVQSTYSRCAETQSQQLIDKLKLISQQQRDTRYPTFESCIKLDQNQQLVAISQPLHMPSGYADYNLDLYLIDNTSEKILNHYHYPMKISSDIGQYENLQFDIHRFSTDNATPVIGLALTYRHLGRIDITIREIKLFKITNHQLQLVLDKFMTNYSGNERPSMCENNKQTETQILLHPLKQSSHGLADIQLTEKAERIELNEENCSTQRIMKKQRHIMKFDGKKYRFEHLKFLDFGI
jgi:hypothetical protein